MDSKHQQHQQSTAQNQVVFNIFVDSGQNNAQAMQNLREILQQVASTFQQVPSVSLQLNTSIPDPQFLFPSLLQQQLLQQQQQHTVPSAYSNLSSYRMPSSTSTTASVLPPPQQSTAVAASLKRAREQTDDLASQQQQQPQAAKRQKLDHAPAAHFQQQPARRPSMSAAYNFQPHELANLPLPVLNEFASAFGIPQGQDSMDVTQRLVRRLSEAKTNDHQLAERVQVSVLFDGHNHGFLIRRNASNLKKLYEMVAAVLQCHESQFDLYLNTSKLNREVANPIEYYHIADGSVLQVLPSNVLHENIQQQHQHQQPHSVS